MRMTRPARLNYRSKSCRLNGAGHRGKWASGKLGVLYGRNFRRFYAGYATSLLGTSMSAVAITFAVLDSGGTPTGLGLVFAANIVPMVAFLLGGGVIADRLGRRPVMLGADLARCAAQGAPRGRAVREPPARLAVRGRRVRGRHG
jgi:Transmembrane secretion effector